ncbi:RDD family protein [Cellulomonas endometrii]|uniref:RDD family protein n=1 Tax=Cellulomonas endometrii TaxID=3036301 RepID=UPI0024AD340B|nr:RDD family protein [Cellulomonas endometrii]
MSAGPGSLGAGTGAGTVAVRECAGCRRPLKPDARFCTACGTPVQADVTVTVVEGAQPRSRADGRPREARPAVLHPAFGEATPAGPGRRVLAYAIDAAAVGLVGGALLAWTGSVLLVALVVAELALGLLVWEAHTGRTLGNTVLGLRTAREETPYSVGPARAFLRGLVLAAGHAVAGLGQWVVVASAAFDTSGRAQAWHDRIGRAVVVDVRAHERAVEALHAAEDARVAAVGAGQGVGRPAGPAGRPGGAPRGVGPSTAGPASAVPSTAGPASAVPSTAVPAVPGPSTAAASGAAPAGVVPQPVAAHPPVAPAAGGYGAGAPHVGGVTAPGTPARAAGDPAAPTGRRAARAAAVQGTAPGTAGPGSAASGAAGPGTAGPGTAGQPVAPASVPPAAPVGAVGGWTGVRPIVPARAEPEPAVAPRAPHQAQPAPFLVTLDTGQVMSVTGPGLIGRSPRPAPGERCDHVIVVDDPERSVSRTHARFGIDNGTFWVSDAGSGNGTTLRLPGGRVIPVPADQRVLVPSGSTIQVGDRGVRIDAPTSRG